MFSKARGLRGWHRVGLSCLLAMGLAGPVVAREAAQGDAPHTVASRALVAFNSDEGLARMGYASARVDFPALANQFEAQSNIAFCGPTSAAIVLNALFAGSPDVPRDRSRLRPEDLRFLPKNMDASVPRFTQDNVFAKGRKTRAQVLGEPVNVNGKEVRDPGFQVRQLSELLQAHGAITQLVIVDDKKPDQDIRADLIGNLQHAGDYVIVNYKRDAVGQRGGAHLSPLGAYDSGSDSFLVMDVNPANAGWVWMPAATLIQGMRTFDTVENRGYILVSRKPWS